MKRWTIRADAAAAVAACRRAAADEVTAVLAISWVTSSAADAALPGQRMTGGGQSDPLSDLLQSAGIGGLGGLLAGGSSGGVLGDLLKQFDQSGQGDAARSWVSRERTCR